MGSGRGGGGYYPDEGSAFWEIYSNVFSNASLCTDDCQWLHIWTSSINHITTHDCFTDTATEEDNGTDCPQYNNTVVKPGGPWPPAAQAIMDGAGTLTQFDCASLGNFECKAEPNSNPTSYDCMAVTGPCTPNCTGKTCGSRASAAF